MFIPLEYLSERIVIFVVSQKGFVSREFLHPGKRKSRKYENREIYSSPRPPDGDDEKGKRLRMTDPLWTGSVTGGTVTVFPVIL
jgi:hypothetical protein